MSKVHKNQPENVPNGQSWNNVSNKIVIVLEYNPKNKKYTEVYTDVND